MIHASTSEGVSRPEETEVFKEAKPAVRYHYMDNLRALAMFAGVVFHAALAYSPLLQNFWFTSGSQTSISIDIVSFFAHLFRMPVFFLISGFFAIMMIEKRGLGGFIKNRSLRILLPFIIFFPILGLAIMLAIGWAIENVENLSPMLEFLKGLANNPDAPKPPLSTMHLWFLFNLFLFVLTTALLYKLKFFQSELVKKLSSVRFVIFVLPFLMIPAMFNQPAPHPPAEKFYPELWSFGFYGFFFILGCMVFLKKELLDELVPFKNTLLVISLLAYAVFYYSLSQTSSKALMDATVAGFDPGWIHLHVAILESFIAVYMTLYCLIVGRQLLNRQNKALKLISDSSYWVYLVHLPVLLMLQFILADMEVNMWIGFTLSTLGTFLIGMLTYVAFVRWTPIGWLLNGRKK